MFFILLSAHLQFVPPTKLNWYHCRPPHCKPSALWHFRGVRWISCHSGHFPHLGVKLWWFCSNVAKKTSSDFSLGQFFIFFFALCASSNLFHTSRKQTFYPRQKWTLVPVFFAPGTRETFSPGWCLQPGLKVPAQRLKVLKPLVPVGNRSPDGLLQKGSIPSIVRCVV